MPTPENIKLSYLSSVEIPKGSSASTVDKSDKSITISELSGMVYLPKVDRNGAETGTGILRAVGDKTQTAQKNPIDGAKADEPQSAIFDFELKLKGGKLEINPIQAVAIDVKGYQADKSEFSKMLMPGQFLPEYVWDTEDIVQLSNGKMLVTLEGFDEKHKPGMEKFPRVGGGIAIVEADGHVSGMLALPDDLRPTEQISDVDGKSVLIKGQRPNVGLEAAGITEDNKTLFVGMEAPVVQDGALPNFERGGISRILRYEQNDSGSFSMLKGHISYPLEKIPQTEAGAVLSEKCDNGLVDILPLSSNRFLTLERATIFYEDGRVRNSVRVYDVKLGEDGNIESKKEAYNSQDLESREDIKPSPLGKAQAGKLPPGGQRAENFEGLSFGPVMEGGGRTVMLLSDDNGRETQRTLLVLLSIDETSSKK